jgi:hypothetical protein
VEKKRENSLNAAGQTADKSCHKTTHSEMIARPDITMGLNDRDRANPSIIPADIIKGENTFLKGALV